MPLLLGLIAVDQNPSVTALSGSVHCEVMFQNMEKPDKKKKPKRGRNNAFQDSLHRLSGNSGPKWHWRGSVDQPMTHRYVAFHGNRMCKCLGNTQTMVEDTPNSKQTQLSC